MFIRKSFATAAVLAATMMASPATIAAPYGVKIGVLTCTVDSGWGYILGSSKEVRCAYHPDHGSDDYYVGSISKFGLDIGYTSAGALVWDVIAPTSDMRHGALQGDYAGASASATVAAGLGANVLAGGFDKSLALQPVSFESNSGLDVAAGIGALRLRTAPPQAQPVVATPPPPPVAQAQPAMAIATPKFLVSFAFNKAALTRKSRRLIRDAASAAMRTRAGRILVTGYADHVGTDRYNERLSLRRAEAVRTELVRDGIADSRIYVAGRGFHDPLVSTRQGVREAENRRVVIELRGYEENREAAR